MQLKREMSANKEGLPAEAFAIVTDINDPGTWKLPHHKGAVSGSRRGKPASEKTVDWSRMPAAVAALSPRLKSGQRLDVSPAEMLRAAEHLAAHYRAAAKPLPDILAVLV